MEEIIHVGVPGHNEQILHSLHELQQRGLYCDISLEASNGFAYVHHVVLAANGAEFQSLIISNTKTYSTNITKKLDCGKYCIQVIEAFVVYLYTGEINIEKKYISDFIKLCNDLNLTCVTVLLKDFIESVNVDLTLIEKFSSSQSDSLLLVPQTEIQHTLSKVERELSDETNKQPSALTVCKVADSEVLNNTENIIYGAKGIQVQTINEGNSLYLRPCNNKPYKVCSEKNHEVLDSDSKYTVECDEKMIMADKSLCQNTNEDMTKLKGDKSSCQNTNEDITKGDKSSCQNTIEDMTKGSKSSCQNRKMSNKMIKVRIKREKLDSFKMVTYSNLRKVEKDKNHVRSPRKMKYDSIKGTEDLNNGLDKIILKKRKKISDDSNFLNVVTCFENKTISGKKLKTEINKIKIKTNTKTRSKTVTETKDKKQIKNFKSKSMAMGTKFKLEKNKRGQNEDNSDGDLQNIFTDNEKSSPKREKKSQLPVWKKCGRCSLIFESYSEHAAHMRDVHKPYPCQLCKWVGHKRHLHASHMYGQHKIIAYPETYPLVQCDEEGCNFKCLGINLHEHKRCHLHKTDQLVCDMCGMKFTSIGGLRNHSFIHQDEDFKYKCKECGKVFGWKNLLTNHLFNEHASIKLCHLCPFKTKSKTTLNIHLHNKHGEPIPENQVVHRCDQCEFYCFSSTYLKIHKEQSHSDMANYKCSFCPKSFKSQKSLRMHRVATHDSKTVMCPHCDYATYSKSALTHHLNSTHSDARPYACHLCEYSCKLKCNLGKHIKNVHKLDSTTSKSVTSVNTSDTHQEVELGSSDFPERRNDDYDLLLSISRHVGNEEGNMLSLPKTSEEPGFMSLPRTSKSTDDMSMTILPKSSEEHGFMSLPRTSKGTDVMSMTKMTEHVMFSTQSEGSVDNLISKHMVQEGDKTFISI